MPTPFAIWQKRRRARANVKRFASLIKTPATDAFSMPAGARLRFVATAGAAAGATAATLTGASDRTIRTPLLAAGAGMVIDFVAKDVTVTPASGFEVHVDTGLGRWQKIAEVA